MSSPASENRQSDVVHLPRWIVYCQAILLGLVATTCFIAGLFIGSFGNSAALPDESTDFRVSGKIRFLHNNTWHPDSGAVAILLPESPGLTTRQDPATITPRLFQPLENPAISSIRDSGGHIVRGNLDGEFEFFVSPGKYVLLIISNARVSDRQQQLERQQVALLSQYFLPVENLVGKHEYYWKPLNVSIKDVDAGTIEFR